MKKIDDNLQTVINKFSAILTALDKNLQSFDPDKAELVFGDSKERKELLAGKPEQLALDERFQRLIGYARDYQAHITPPSTVFNGASAPVQ